MLHLKDRNGQIPYGLSFKLPEANWEGTRWSSLDTLARSAMEVGRANPFIAKKCNWPVTLDGWIDTVDVYNAAICKAHGWTGYYVETSEGGQSPKWQSRQGHGLFGAAAVGVKVLSEMFGAEGPIRDKALATKRAEVCLKCPKHDRGDWKRFLTVPAQRMIMTALGALKDLDLTTEHDEELQTCIVCDCPMRGKIWARTEHILKHLPAADKAELDVNCWITGEEKAIATTPR